MYFDICITFKYTEYRRKYILKNLIHLIYVIKKNFYQNFLLSVKLNDVMWSLAKYDLWTTVLKSANIIIIRLLNINMDKNTLILSPVKLM